MPYAVGTDTDRLTYLTAPLSPLIGVAQTDVDIRGKSGLITRSFFLYYYLGVKHLNKLLYKHTYFCYTIDVPRGEQKGRKRT